MMDILMYLFETYIHNDMELMVDQEELADELSRAGFHPEDIYKALAWLEKLAQLQNAEQNPYLTGSALTSMRIYTPKEMDCLSTESRGFILFLEQMNVLTPETREMVVDRLMEVDVHDFSLEDLKWVIFMVLFNAPGNEIAYNRMEELLHDVVREEYLH